MKKMPGTPPPSLPELVRATDRMTFVYVEQSVIHRESNAITATDARGTVHIPAASLGALLLGPGTSVTHQAMMLLSECASTAVWVGERGVRYYAHGRSLAKTAKLLQAQAERVTNRNERLAVAREMYRMRFPGEDDVSQLTMQQLRGREGARVRRCYRQHSERTGVEWTKRDYETTDWAGGSPVNMALSAANTSLYGIVHAVIVSLGCSPGLGFVHTGHERSFVYDIADLYKAEITIPAAFDIAASGYPDIGSAARRVVRDRVHASHLLERCVRDIQTLLLGEDGAGDLIEEADVVWLWDGADRQVTAGLSYSDPSLPYPS
ncbi:MAG: type I-E CRISPR-associated endonuclease Cas1e [Jatrophihabitantaceae bacterium]